MASIRVCIAESRLKDEVAVKLLVLSLQHHEPNAILHLYVSNLSQDFLDWLRRRINVVLEPLQLDPSLSWNVKPDLLIDLLSRHQEPILWIDSDIIVTGPIRPLIDGISSEAIVMAPEPAHFVGGGVQGRTKAWGFPVGRPLPFIPNSCFMRVAPVHMPLLLRWRESLQDPRYVEAQQLPRMQRPKHLFGDQDVLAALLGSEEFADIEVRSLVRGRDIAQCLYEDGFGPIERLRSARRLPPLVHSQVSKPWRESAKTEVYLEVSPYTYAARPYLNDLAVEDTAWMTIQSRNAKLLDKLAGGNASLAGLPLAVQKRTFRIARFGLKAIVSPMRMLKKLAT